jgi:hypothetical protein
LLAVRPDSVTLNEFASLFLASLLEHVTLALEDLKSNDITKNGLAVAWRDFLRIKRKPLYDKVCHECARRIGNFGPYPSGSEEAVKELENQCRAHSFFVLHYPVAEFISVDNAAGELMTSLRRFHSDREGVPFTYYLLPCSTTDAIPGTIFSGNIRNSGRAWISWMSSI